MNCLFCQIANKEKPADIVYENDTVLAFKDINPQAPVHLLIVPKKHIASIAENGSEEIAKGLIEAAKQIAQQKGLDGYKLLFNVGKQGGQIIPHLHLHFLAGRKISKKEII